MCNTGCVQYAVVVMVTDNPWCVMMLWFSGDSDGNPVWNMGGVMLYSYAHGALVVMCQCVECGVGEGGVACHGSDGSLSSHPKCVIKTNMRWVVMGYTMVI